MQLSVFVHPSSAALRMPVSKKSKNSKNKLSRDCALPARTFDADRAHILPAPARATFGIGAHRARPA